MSLNAEYVKKHWPLIAGALFGVLVLYYLLENLKGGTASTQPASTTDASTAALQSANDLQNAQLNAQIVTAQLQSNVADTQVAAQLQANLAQTAGEVAVAQQQTSANEAVSLDQDQTAISLQSIQSQQAVDQTSIEGSTAAQIANTEAGAQVDIAGLQTQAALQSQENIIAQISAVGANSKHASTDYQALAPIIALETGQGQAASQIGTANANSNAATTVAKTSAISEGITSVLGALFA